LSHKYRQRQDRKEGKKLSRRRGGYNKPYRRGLIVFVIIILLAIGSGYLITKYIIGSFYGDELSADGQGSNDQDFSGSSIIIGQQDITEENPEDDKNENPSVATNVNNNLENTQHTITLYRLIMNKRTFGINLFILLIVIYNFFCFFYSFFDTKAKS
jgi:hypothetical protein